MKRIIEHFTPRNSNVDEFREINHFSINSENIKSVDFSKYENYKTVVHCYLNENDVFTFYFTVGDQLHAFINGEESAIYDEIFGDDSLEKPTYILADTSINGEIQTLEHNVYIANSLEEVKSFLKKL